MRTPFTDRTRELLQNARYEVLPTSTITGEDQLREIVTRLSGAGITEVFVSDGDATSSGGRLCGSA